MKSMKVFLGIFASLFLLVLVACGSKSGVKATMTSTATTTSMKITVNFSENEHLSDKSATAYIKEFTVDSSDTKTLKETKNVTFSNNVYTTAIVDFTGLTKGTEYLYELYVTYQSYSELITSEKFTTTSSGDSEETSIVINTVEEFNAIGNDPSAHYKLNADLDFSGVTLATGLSTTKRFQGTFDGGNKTIKNLKLNSDTNIGLFSYTDGATIKNLKLENVTGDYSGGRASSNIGALIGTAEKTKVSNVTVNNVNITIKGNSSSELNVGGLVGVATQSTFEDSKTTNVVISFPQNARLKLNVGLFIGSASGNSVGTIKSGERDVSLLASKCSGSGKIDGLLYYPSTEGFAHFGGFIGDDSSMSLIIDSYSDVEIKLTKDTTDTYGNKFNLAVGGFIGCSNSGTGINVEKCATKSSIEVYAGVKPTSDLTYVTPVDFDGSGELADYKNELNNQLDAYFEKFQSADYTSTNYEEIRTKKNDAKQNILSGETDGAQAKTIYMTAVEEMKAILNKVDSTTLTKPTTKTNLMKASIGKFIGVLSEYSTGIENSVYKATEYEVRAKDTISITTDSTTEDVKILFKDVDGIGLNDAPTKVSTLIAYTDQIDLSVYGENVKAFLEN